MFCGNQGLYDLWGGVATDVAGMLIPIGIASKAAKAAEIGTKAAKSASIASKLTKPNVVQHIASGAHGVISAGTGSVKQQFYEKGSLEAIDWGEVAGKSAVGGIIGTGTSYGGAKLSQGTTYLLSKNATVSSLLYSESAATRAASNFVVSGTAEVVSGGITRFAGGVLTTGGNVKEAWAQAINPQSIIFDAALGGTMGGFKGIKKPQQNSAVINSDGTASGVQEIKKPQQINADLNSPEARKNSSIAFETIGKSTTPKVIYGTGDIAKYEFNMIENPGPLTELPNIPKSESPAKNFYGGRYNVEVLQEDQIMYRAGNSQNPYGRWFTSEPPTSIVNVRVDRAVKPQWINPKTGVCEATSHIDTVYAIKVPKGTTVYSGPIGPQGGSHLGGYDIIQKYIDSPWNFEVVAKMPLK